MDAADRFRLGDDEDAPDEDMESCSWNPEHIVRDSALVEAHDGARICTECLQQHTRDPIKLPCAGCGQHWEGPRKDCMDHLNDCTYVKWQDDEDERYSNADFIDRQWEDHYRNNSSSITGIISGP